MNSERHPPLEDVIDEIMQAETDPTHEVLSRWIARYPGHRDALARFFATWAMQEKSVEKVTVDEELAGKRLASQAINLLYHQKAAAPVAETRQDCERLCQAIKNRGLTEDEFAARCSLDDSILVKLDRRHINAGSIPRKCLEVMASVLDYAVAVVQSMVAGDPVPVGANKTKKKPVIQTEDFLDAVRASDLPEDKKAAWTEVVLAERATGGHT